MSPWKGYKIGGSYPEIAKTREIHNTSSVFNFIFICEVADHHESPRLFAHYFARTKWNRSGSQCVIDILIGQFFVREEKNVFLTRTPKNF